MKSQTQAFKHADVAGLHNHLPQMFCDKLAIHSGKNVVRFSLFQLWHLGFMSMQVLNVGA